MIDSRKTMTERMALSAMRKFNTENAPYSYKSAILLEALYSILNDIIKALGGTPKSFLTDTGAFPIIVILSDAWKEIGWSAIIFIAALMGIDGTLFEAAIVEGANSWQRVRHITLPAIKPVIVVVLLMKIGTILDAGFNQLYMLYSPAVWSIEADSLMDCSQ